MEEIGAALVEILFEHGLGLIESVLERWGWAPADKPHFIRLGLSDRRWEACLDGSTARASRAA
jgi:hypothetical protein